MKELQHKGKIYHLRAAVVEDAAVLRRLLNAAYKELADLGLNFRATDQDEDYTRKQIQKNRVFVLCNSDLIIGTISVHDENWFTNCRSLYVSKFAIQPELKRNGLGMMLMNFVEELAASEAYDAIQLDTAKPAVHLVELYQRIGYKIIGETHFEGRTYDSWLFEKRI